MLELRFLARRKTLAAVAILTLGLAIGASTAALSVLDAFLRSSLAVPDPDRLVVLQPEREMPGRGSVQFSDAYPNYLLMRQTQRSFSEIAATVQQSVSWDDHTETRQIPAVRVTATFTPTFRVTPFLGRGFEAKEEGPSPAPVVMISHALWSGAFGGDRGIIGKTMDLNGAPHTIVGVMPPGFSQPVSAELWLPFDIPAAQRTSITGARQLTIFGRIREGSTLDAAQREMTAFTARALEAAPIDNKDYRYTATTLRDNLLQGADSTAFFVLAAAIGLLALAVLNLASLLVAWGFERGQEFAVRLALGAGQRHVARLVLRQSLVVIAGGAITGIVFAFAGLSVLSRFDLGPTITPFIAHARLQPLAVLAAALLSIVAGLAAGALPAWLTGRSTIGDVLRSSSRSTTLSRGAMAWQRGVVFAQATVSVVIVVAAILIGSSFWHLSTVPDGFDSRDRIVARVVLPDTRYGTHPARAAFARALAANLAAEPELARSGFTSTLPAGDIPSGARFLIQLPDGSFDKDPALFHFRRVSPDYIGSMGIPIVKGRAFTPRDDSGSVAVAIVSRALADRLWPNEEAIGKTIFRAPQGGAPPAPLTVVGIVGNTMDGGYSAPAGETVYVPYTQISNPRLSIVAAPRPGITPLATTAAIRRAIARTDPVLAAGNISTLDALVLQANALPRLRTVLLMVFAIVAVGIVSLGSYGVMSQLVSTREREFAVRLIFGASPGELGWRVLRQVARVTVPGIVVGLGVAAAVSRSLESFLFGVKATSLAALLGACSLLVVLSTLAALPSVVRAMRVDVRKGTGAG